MDKQQIIEAFRKNPTEHWQVSIFREKGFIRKKCPTCGKFFWTLDADREKCADPPCQNYEFLGNPITREKWDYIKTWKEFEKFFTKEGHTSIPRMPVVCRWRPDLFFVIASIVDFQRIENGRMVFSYPANPLIVPQPCLRFNDIPNIGVTGRHHSVFDMAEQAAFYKDGKEGYWKDRCIELNFRFLTESMGVPPEELVYIEDVWAGAGAYGPSLETLSRGLELVNSVFMQYEVTDSGSRELPLKVIDVGWGHERLTWFSQGTPTGYDAVFGPVIEKMKKEAAINYDLDFFLRYARLSGSLNMDEVGDLEAVRASVAKTLGVTPAELLEMIEPLEALYAICDHAKTLGFAITDGALPSNVGGGYNLRVLVRRALGFIDEFGFPFRLADIVAQHAEYLRPIYPELVEHIADVNAILEVEEKRYKETSGRLKKTISSMLERGAKFTDEKLVELYDSQGITPELIHEEAGKQGVSVSIPSDFYSKVTGKHMAEQKEKATETKSKLIISVDGLPFTEQLYYGGLKTFNAKVLRIMDGKHVVLDKTAFYPRSGGQENDCGTINGKRVYDVQKIEGVIVHSMEGLDFAEGTTVDGEIDWPRREQLTSHHTATHIVNLAARGVLGSWVWQHGASKSVDKARLDITHHSALSESEIEKIEKLANEIVSRNIPVTSRMLPKSEAETKYGFRIYQGGVVPERELRIVSVGELDHEACGGTHCTSTGQVGPIVITGTKRIQDGIVRLEYCAGPAAMFYLGEKEKFLSESARLLGVSWENVPTAVEDLFNKWKEQRRKKAKKKGGILKSMSEPSRISPEGFEDVGTPPLGVGGVAKGHFSKPSLDEQFEELRKKEIALKRAASMVCVSETDLPKTIERFQKDLETHLK